MQLRAGKRALYAGLCGLALIAALYFAYFNVFAALRTTSPSGEYQAHYNRITKIITVRKLNSDLKWLEGECVNPEFLWSPDSRYLAINISYPNGGRRAEIRDFEHSSAMTALDYDFAERIEITKWLDSAHVLIEFSRPSQTASQSGWCVYNISTRAIGDLGYAN